MPFDSEKQRKYLWASKPEVARQIAHDSKGGKMKATVPRAKFANLGTSAVSAHGGGRLTGKQNEDTEGNVQDNPDGPDTKGPGKKGAYTREQFLAAMEYEKRNAKDGESAKARAERVHQHLSERPNYYDELSSMLDPDNANQTGKMHAKMTAPRQLVEPRKASFDPGIQPERPLRCGNCSMYGGGNELTGKCSALKAPGTDMERLTVHYFNYCALYRPQSIDSGLSDRVSKGARPRALMRTEPIGPKRLLRKGARGGSAHGPVPTIAPIAGSSPREETPALPDYQDIYFQPEDSEHKKREREQQSIRRRANAERNHAVYGFHGTAIDSPEPTLRYEGDDTQAPQQHTQQREPRRSAREPVVEAPELEDRVTAGRTEDTGKTDHGRTHRNGDRRNDQTVDSPNRPEPKDGDDDDSEDEDSQRKRKRGKVKAKRG